LGKWDSVVGKSGGGFDGVGGEVWGGDVRLMIYYLGFKIFLRQSIIIKMKAVKNDIDIYLSKLPKEIQLALDRVRQTIMALVPDAEQTINYGMPMIRYQGKMLVGFDVFKNHCSLFPCSGSTVIVFKEALKNFVTTKGSRHFTIEKQLPLLLIRKIVKQRMLENELKALDKKRKP
jgi:uncharacterized protein YdhG (YjbR/CyaY superfamily)